MPKTFDDLYPTRKDYKRFDQRNTAFRQRFRKTGTHLDYNTDEHKKKMIDRNIPGFTIVDYAFKQSAGLYESIPDLLDGGLNTGFYHWTSLGVGKKPVGVPKWEGTTEASAKIIRKAAKYFGALEVGFTKMDKRWIYSHNKSGKPIVFEDVEEAYVTNEKAVIPESYKYVIVFTVPMEYKENSYAPTALDVTSNMGYSRMQILAGYMAEFIRALGWHAIPSGNDTSLSIPTAIQAGLGHMGRHGRVITWDQGPLIRICKIFTDLPLPQSPLAPEGIIKFCEDCEKCAKMCPSGSIPFGERTWFGENDANNPDVFKWYCNAEKCLAYWNEVGSGCSICFRVCNFTKKKGTVHEIVKWFIRNVPLLNKFFVWTDELFGYGKMSDPSKYWIED
jgi:reductive dehalogenase